jgi:hypothetical protein
MRSNRHFRASKLKETSSIVLSCMGAAWLCLQSVVVAGQEPSASIEAPTPADMRDQVAATNTDEPYSTGWTFAFDNDLLAFRNDDFDYTFGGIATLAGRRAVESPISLDRMLAPLDRFVPYKPGEGAVHHALQFALIAFTPDDLNASDPIYDDRPYASAIGIANVRTFFRDPTSPVYETSFSLGVLGLDVAKSLQRGLHKALDLDEIPEGWNHQISDGGELTFRLGWGRQALLAQHVGDRGLSRDLKWRVETHLGLYTEASVGLSGRWGRIGAPWWTHSPERSSYLSQASPIVDDGGGGRELYLWAGAKARLRLYNVLLQGQFRESEVEISSSDVERLVLEAWVGATWELPSGTRLSYVMRYETAEIKLGLGNRDMRWAGLVVSRPFR